MSLSLALKQLKEAGMLGELHVEVPEAPFCRYLKVRRLFGSRDQGG